MKITTLLLLCCLATPAFAQNYHPLIQRGTYWDELEAQEWGLCAYAQGVRYWFRGDTTVNGQVYQMLVYSGIVGDPSAPQFCPPYTVDTTTGTIYALMREDIAAKKVFQLDTATHADFVLFDFSVSTGDSVTAGNPAHTMYVESDSDQILINDLHRRTLVINKSGERTIWQEGIGDVYYLWNPLAPQCICPHLICYYQTGQGGPDNGCVTVVGTNESINDAPIGLVIFPNPGGETLKVRVPKDHVFDHLTVFDFSGKVMADQHVAGEYAADVAVRSWPAGHYSAIVWYKGQCLGRQIFQKN